MTAPLPTDEEYAAAAREADEILRTARLEPGSKAYERLVELSDVLYAYESAHPDHRIDLPP
jgi:hypothetical protein